MKLVILYLCVWLALLAALFCAGMTKVFSAYWSEYLVAYHCALIGGMSGVLYCLRAVYLTRCVRKRWDSDWHVWYYLRPLVSLLMGLVAYIFLRAGLLVLGVPSDHETSPYGFYAIAFIAGLNVVKFLVKLEDIAKSVWGISLSGASSSDNKGEDK